MREQTFCQSCGMPPDEEVSGTEAGGARSREYCMYCYQAGKYAADVTMEEMTEQCAHHMVNPDMTAQRARDMMRQFFPTLKRWRRV